MPMIQRMLRLLRDRVHFMKALLGETEDSLPLSIMWFHVDGTMVFFFGLWFSLFLLPICHPRDLEPPVDHSPRRRRNRERLVDEWGYVSEHDVC